MTRALLSMSHYTRWAILWGYMCLVVGSQQRRCLKYYWCSPASWFGVPSFRSLKICSKVSAHLFASIQLFQTPCTVTEDTSCQSCRQGLSTGFGSQSATSSDLRLQCSWCTRCVGYVDQSASYCTSTLMQLCKASTTTAALLLTSAATSVPGRTSPAIGEGYCMCLFKGRLVVLCNDWLWRNDAAWSLMAWTGLGCNSTIDTINIRH